MQERRLLTPAQKRMLEWHRLENVVKRNHLIELEHWIAEQVHEARNEEEFWKGVHTALNNLPLRLDHRHLRQLDTSGLRREEKDENTPEEKRIEIREMRRRSIEARRKMHKLGLRTSIICRELGYPEEMLYAQLEKMPKKLATETRRRWWQIFVRMLEKHREYTPHDVWG